MKRMMILLTATTLALVPFASNAKKPTNDSDYPLEVLSCDCASEQGLEGEVIYTCNVSWSDVIAEEREDNLATYGASIDVEWEEEDTELDRLASAELEYDWSEVCAGGTCRVENEMFRLINVPDGQNVILTAAVKAFDNRSEGRTPRSIDKSTMECDVVAPIDPI